MKKETLEEAAENGWFNTNSMSAEHKEGFIEGFIQGANYQAERMYSEEEVKSAFRTGFFMGYGSPVSELDLKEEYCNKWFERIKKK